MILNRVQVEQAIDGHERGTFEKELVLLKVRAEAGETPLCMVRKRDAKLVGDGASLRGAVLLVHGYGQNRYAWHLPARSFSNYLAVRGWDVFNVDLRGHGRSRHFGARRPSHVSEFVHEDLPAALAEVQRVSGFDRVFLLGHSLGGLVSCSAAPLVGDAVAGLVAIGMPYMFTKGSWALTLAGRLMLGVDRRLPLGEGALALRMWGETVRLLRAFVESPFFPLPIRGFAPGTMEPTVLGQHMSLAMDAGSITVMRNMFLAAAESRATGHRFGGFKGLTDSFEALDVPLLVIAGAKDDLAPPPSVEPAFARSSSNDKTYRVFDQGHIDLIVGRAATSTVWPCVAEWLEARAFRSRRPSPT